MPNDVTGASDEAYSDDLLRRTAEHLDLVMQSIGVGLTGNGEHPSTIRESAQVATAIGRVASEIRARDKAKAKAKRDLKPDVVMDWLRELPAERKLHFLRELAATLDEEKRSVLA